MGTVRDWANLLSKSAELVSLCGILIMVGIICADVLGSKLLGLPVPGSTEIVSLVQAAAMAFVVAATQRDRGHVSVAMFLERLPSRVQACTRVLISVLGLAMFAILIWQGLLYANQLRLAHEVTSTVKVPVAPFVYAFAVAMAPAAMLMVCDLVDSLKEVVAPWNR